MGRHKYVDDKDRDAAWMLLKRFKMPTAEVALRMGVSTDTVNKIKAIATDLETGGVASLDRYNAASLYYRWSTITWAADRLGIKIPQEYIDRKDSWVATRNERLSRQGPSATIEAQQISMVVDEEDTQEGVDNNAPEGSTDIGAICDGLATMGRNMQTICAEISRAHDDTDSLVSAKIDLLRQDLQKQNDLLIETIRSLFYDKKQVDNANADILSAKVTACQKELEYVRKNIKKCNAAG